MMFRLLLAGIPALAGMINALAQDNIPVLSDFTQVEYNPSSPAIARMAEVSLHKREVTISPVVDLVTQNVNTQVPFVNKQSANRWGGLGVSFTKKEAGKSGMVASQSLRFSLAYNLRLTKDRCIAFGIQPGLVSNRTSLQSFTTANQWLAKEFRFDPNAPLGEAFTENRISFVSFNAGATFYKTGSGDQQTSWLTIASYYINEPHNSFSRHSGRANREYVLNASTTLYQNGSYRVASQAFYLYNHSHQYSLELSSKFQFNNLNPYDIIQSGNIALLARSNLRTSIAMGISFSQPHFAFGLSYQLPFSDNSQAYFNNAIEFSLKMFTSVRRRKPSQTITEQKPEPVRREIKFNNTQPAEKQPQPETETIRQNVEQYSKVSSIQFELDKQFKFEFGRTTLDDEAKTFLKELYQLLVENPEYQIEVVGHTDNVGKPIANLKLSTARASAVANYLVSLGLSRERIRSRGAGDSNPVAPNDSEENRSRNRRVQFIIYVSK